MTRRGLFGALLGGIAASACLRGLVRLPVRPAGRWTTVRGGAAGLDAIASADVRADHIVMLKTSAMGKSELAAHILGDAVALPGTAPWRTAPAAPEPNPPWSAGRDLPEVWPGRSAEITATASLPPLAQVERLVELFGASGGAAPAFAAALIGELVLTRMRLAADQHMPRGLGS